MRSYKNWLGLLAGLLILLTYPLSAAADDGKKVTKPKKPPTRGTIVGKLVGKKKRVRNSVVYIQGLKGKYKARTRKMNQKSQKFRPHILPIVKGTTVKFLNSDNTGHNVFSPDGEKYDLGNWGKGESRSFKFKKTGVYTQLCKMHPSMLAYIVVLDNPYFGRVKSNGSFKIKNVPPGTYTLGIWNRREQKATAKVKVVVGEEAVVEIAVK